MTEDEFKTKITCHLSIGVQPTYHPSTGDGIRDGGPWPCLGSTCSAWRWQWNGLVMAFEENGERKFIAPTGEQPHGFCGLAGKP